MSGYRITDTHVYFVGGPLSQWAKSDFTESLSGKEYYFKTAEQFMMAGKAVLFHDFDILDEIMLTDHPRDQKALGRKVKNFDPDVWNSHARNVVYFGNIAKFKQNKHLRTFLMETEDRYLVEGASYDRIWGVGLNYKDPLIEDKKNWKGKNWLGETLMKVREDIRGEENENYFECE